MNPALYDAWYDSPRGLWIGEAEYRLIERDLSLRPGMRVLDVGCGTGWFTRRLARLRDMEVNGVDINAEWLDYARSRDSCARYVQADALALPFADNCFDAVLSIAALCFTADWQKSVAEIVRVRSGRFAIGMLNRHSLLWHEKGRGGGSGAYRGARWITPDELKRCVKTLPVANICLQSAVFLPSGSLCARVVERLLPSRREVGGFLVLSGEKRADLV